VELVVLDKAAGPAGFLEVRRRLAGRRFDLLLMMHASLRANLASLAVRADVRLGFDRARARDYQWLFSNARVPARAAEHVMDGLFGFAEVVGVRERTLRWDIPVSGDDRAFAERCIPSGQRTVVISPCSSQRFRNYRNWSIENYAAVAEHAARAHGASVVLTGGATELERRYAAGISGMARHGAPRDLVGKTTLKQLLALLERADILICP